MNRLMGAVIGLSMGWLASAAAAQMRPHLATYEVKLTYAKPSADIAGLDGRYVLDLQDGCDVWVMNERLLLHMLPNEGESLLMDVQNSTVEGKQDGSYRFESLTFQDGEAVERRAGRRMGQKIDFSEPAAEAPLPLPDGTLFPAGLIQALLEAAKAKKERLSMVTFDGTSETPLYDSYARIGPAEKGIPGAGKLPEMTRWRISLSFYQAGSKAAEPEQTVDYWLYENGVADTMTYDYGDFAMTARLSHLQMHPACD